MSSRLGALPALFAMLFGALMVGSVATAPAALAYQGCNSTSSASASADSANGGGSVDFTVTLKDCNGGAIAGAQVTFSQQAGPAGCTVTFTPSTAVTDANGQATTTATLPAGCPCQYTLAGSGAGVTVTTTVRENGCLPFTGAARAAARTVPPVLSLGALVVGLLLVAASAYGLARGRA